MLVLASDRASDQPRRPTPDPICGRAHVYIGNRTELIAHRGSRVLIPAGTAFWVIPQNMMSNAFCCDLLTWPRFQRGNAAHQPAHFLQSSISPAEKEAISRDWHRSLRVRYDHCVPVEVDPQTLPRADQLDAEQIIQAIAPYKLRHFAALTPPDIDDIRARWDDIKVGWVV